MFFKSTVCDLITLQGEFYIDIDESNYVFK